MREKQETHSIRISQVMSAALAAVTAALLGSTMGLAGTVVGAGLASVVSTVGGALYLRSIQRTGQGVRTVRDRVVARAGTTTVTVLEDEPGERPDHEEPAPADDKTDDRPPPARKVRWPALVAGSVLAFVLGMVVITGVEWLRGEPLSGGEGTTVGDIVRTHPDGGDEREEVPPPATDSSTTPSSTGGSTVTDTSAPPLTSEDDEAPETPGGSTTTHTTPPATTSGGEPTGSATLPPSGGAG